MLSSNLLCLERETLKKIASHSPKLIIDKNIGKPISRLRNADGFPYVYSFYSFYSSL